MNSFLKKSNYAKNELHLFLPNKPVSADTLTMKKHTHTYNTKLSPAKSKIVTPSVFSSE